MEAIRTKSGVSFLSEATKYSVTSGILQTVISYADSAQISVSGTLINYDPSSLAATISYRREVISGMCRTKSNKVTVTVLPSITNNTITPDKPEVCFNTSPGLITGSPLTGGAGGTPTWIWQDSTSGVAFTNISGASTQSYDPIRESHKTDMVQAYHQIRSC